MNAWEEVQGVEHGSGVRASSQNARTYFQGVRIDNVSAQQALHVVETHLANHDRRNALRVFFPNVHSIHLARQDKEFLSCINEADLLLPDGSGLMIAGKILGRPIVENLNGTDFIPKVLQRAEERGWSVYLFGALPHIIEECRNRIQAAHPRLKIVGHHQGHIPEGEDSSIIADINEKAPNIILVALGSPLQEKWVARNAAKMNAGVCFAVGGLFDFLAGKYRRAPVWMRRIGAEFIYRFVQDPRSKWRRLLIEQPLFLMLIFGERFIPRRARSFSNRSTKGN